MKQQPPQASRHTDGIVAPLPLPEEDGGPSVPFRDAVDAYTQAHNVSRAETYRRIAAITGNSTNGLRLRYDQRGDDVWCFSRA